MCPSQHLLLEHEIRFAKAESAMLLAISFWISTLAYAWCLLDQQPLCHRQWTVNRLRKNVNFKKGLLNLSFVETNVTPRYLAMCIECNTACIRLHTYCPWKVSPIHWQFSVTKVEPNGLADHLLGTIFSGVDRIGWLTPASSYRGSCERMM